jgi:TonB family protein
VHLPDSFIPDRRLGAALAASVVAHGLIATLIPEPAPYSAAVAHPVTARLHSAASAPSGAIVPAETMVAAEPSRQPLERRYDTPPLVGDAPAGRWPEAMMQTPEATASDEPAAVDTNDRRLFLEGLRQYHAALSRVAGSFRRYPPQARQEGREGRVALRLGIVTGGTPNSVLVIGSSGHEALDRAALDLIRLAASHTAVPETLRGMDFAIDLAVDYNLEDAIP